YTDGFTSELAVGLELIDVELVLPLDRHVDPWLGRVKIEMPRAEAEPVSGRDRGEVGQRAVLECVEVERAGMFRLAAGGIVAPAHQDRRLVSRRGAELVSIDAGIGLARLAHRLAEGAIALDAVHGSIA